MSFGFKIMAEGDYACFTRPEMKVERVSYDWPTPSALEGMLKSVYWKPAIRYVIDKIIVFNKIEFANIRRNEVKEKMTLSEIQKQMKDEATDICIYTSEKKKTKGINQRASMVLKNVKYGIQFHFELTGLKNDHADECEEKHFNIIKRRLTKGQFFRVPCFGCAEFPVKRLELVEDFDYNLISNEIFAMGEVDYGFMLYRPKFEDGGKPLNDDWEDPLFSDKVTAEFYRPRMIKGIIDVAKYREARLC